MTEKVFEIMTLDSRPRTSYVRMALWPLPLGWAVTDISVPNGHQGQGIGRELMGMALGWADEQGIDLCISLAPTGLLDYDALEAWYQRLGFAYADDGLLRRVARHHAEPGVLST